MSSILPLAKRLREKSEEELAQLLSSLPNAVSCVDLFDLAKLFLGKRELEERIRKLPAPELSNLSNGKATAALRNAMLAESKVFEEAQEALLQIKPLPEPKLGFPSSTLTAFETLLAITEIIFATEQHWLETTKSGIKSVDAKPLAEKFKWQSQDLQLRFRLAIRAGLVQQQNGRWVASATAEMWLRSSRADQWAHLAKSCWDIPKLAIEDDSITRQILSNYPLMDLSKLALLEFGGALGLLDGNKPRSALLSGSFAAVTKAVSAELPKPETRLLVQADLSVVCPGPVDAELHRKLDSFADSEDLGLASRFRISSLSVSHHLESGGNITEIETTLVSASKVELPQPVKYLLSETKERFATLKVRAGLVTKIHSEDEILLTQIMNERSLIHLALKKSDGEITSPSSQELCYFSLRDCGYAAVMVGEDGGLISPRFRTELSEPNIENELVIRAKSLLSGEKISAGLGDVQRQLQFALKNKLQVSLTLEVDGQEQQMLLTPLGLAGNRLRGRDEAKQAERTVPLSRIRSVVLS